MVVRSVLARRLGQTMGENNTTACVDQIEGPTLLAFKTAAAYAGVEAAVAAEAMRRGASSCFAAVDGALHIFPRLGLISFAFVALRCSCV
jgi:hypothetical protein